MQLNFPAVASTIWAGAEVEVRLGIARSRLSVSDSSVVQSVSSVSVLSSSLGVGGKPPQTFQKGRTIYGLPKDYSTLALFYNKKAFRSVGRSQLLIAGANYATIWQSNEDLSIVLNNFNN